MVIITERGIKFYMKYVLISIVVDIGFNAKPTIILCFSTNAMAKRNRLFKWQ